MTRTIYYTATSLDGFIADPEESLGWLLSRHSDEDGPMGYRRFIAGIGALAMGATTYRWVQRQERGTWPYEQPCWVFTHGELRQVRRRGHPVHRRRHRPGARGHGGGGRRT